ncbi:hypothetical protein MHC_01820 [Mycoplasma haemocanis str. Illinois]|uniref:Uncharacterized protein n=1 Tax=Mycoplasma haemocanis (strain Illinois) TaxID=1111676 RepID=H6N6F8_MYCHN|nr:hypothetical protein [Mycoplasma haemocanis]AEW45230.1 hypothetical protein MHC_01820 [Mycoplasma haemocanis str. Illinois]
MEGSLIAKISAGMAGIGAVSVGGAFMAYKSSNKNSITKYLNSLGRKIAESDEDWSLIKKNYSIDKENIPIPGIPKDSIETKLNDLKRWCKDGLKEEFAREKAEKGDYNLIQTWCTKPVKISDHLKHMKLTSLDTSGSGDDDSWNKLKNTYPNGGLKINSINTTGSNKTEGEELSSVDDIKKMKDWCSFTSEKYFKHSEDTLFKRYKYFCTKSS